MRHPAPEIRLRGLRKGRPKPAKWTCITSPCSRRIPSPKAERIRAKEVDVNVPGAAVRIEFEMVVLQIGEVMRHGFLAAMDPAAPYHRGRPFYAHCAGDQGEIRIDDELRSNGTGA